MEADITPEAVQSLIQQQLEVLQKALGIEPDQKQDDELALDKFTEAVGSEKDTINFYTKKSNIAELAATKRYLAERRAEATTVFAKNQDMCAAATARFNCIMDQRRLTQKRINLTKNQKSTV